MIKWIFKWLFRLLLLAVVLVVVFFLSLDSILRVLVEHNIRAQTGMDAEIGRFHLGLVEPVISIEDLKIYNPPASFDGTPFLKIPEIHVEYDRAALAQRRIHVTLLRFNLGELDIVKNEQGRTNIFSLGLAQPEKSAGTPSPTVELKKRTGLEFQQIDVLNVSIGTFKYIDLKDPRNNREQQVGIEDWPMRNVKSTADLASLAVVVALRSGDFLGDLMDVKNSKIDTFKQLGF